MGVVEALIDPYEKACTTSKCVVVFFFSISSSIAPIP